MTSKITKSQKSKYIITITVCSLIAILSFCGRYFTSPLKYVAGFFLGAFGMSFYGILFGAIAFCSIALSGRKVRIPTKYVVNFIMLFVAIVLLVHSITSRFYIQTATKEIVQYSTYVGYLFNYYDFVSFGGVVWGSLVYVLESTLTFWGSLVIFVGLLIWTVVVTGDFFYSYFTGKITLLQEVDTTTQQPVATEQATQVVDDEQMRRTQAWATIMGEGTTDYPEEIDTPTVQVDPQEIFTFAPQTVMEEPQSVQPTPEQAKQILFPQDPVVSPGSSFFATAQATVDVDTDEPVAQPVQPVEEPTSSWKISTTPTVEPVQTTQPFVEEPFIVTQPVVDEQPIVEVQEPIVPQQPVIEKPTTVVQSEPIVVEQPTPTLQFVDVPTVETENEVDIVDIVTDESVEEFTFEEDIVEESTFTPEPPAKPVVQQTYDPDEVLVFEGETPIGNGVVQTRMDFVTGEELNKAQQTVHQYMEYVVPPSDLLTDAPVVEDTGAEDRERAAQEIVRKLAVFNIKVELHGIIVGPSVTQYRFKVLSEKTRMGDFAQYADDLKACLEASDNILIHAPIQGTNLVGIEVANAVKSPVSLRSLLESDTFQNAKGNLVFAIGKDLIGNVIIGDLAKMPHLLVAGTTGSGKSVALNCLIVSLMYKYGPEYLRFLMVDPKWVELSRYNGIPHMLTRETIVDINDALAGMDYLVKEMEARYQLFKQVGVDNIVNYNKAINPKLVQRMPYLIYIVDELADLMATNKKGFEERLGRLTAKARASGIHVVLATQRPDVNVITGTIKNNLSCRMALKVPAQQDSKTILNGAGAERLLGNGDMLYMAPGASGPARVQGAYVSNDEIKILVEFLRDSNELYYDDSISNEIFVSAHTEEPDEIPQIDEGDIPLHERRDMRIYIKKALIFWLTEKKGLASISSLQRGIRIGFNKAGTIKDMCEQLGFIEKPADADSGNRAVKVLVTLEQVNQIFADISDEDMQNA